MKSIENDLKRFVGECYPPSSPTLQAILHLQDVVVGALVRRQRALLFFYLLII